MRRLLAKLGAISRAELESGIQDLPHALWRFDVAHIFGLYDFWGLRRRQRAGAAESPT